MKKYLFLLGIIFLMFSGCLEKPEIKYLGSEIKENGDITNVNIKIYINNPNSIGVEIKKISLNIYALVNNEEIFIGHGEKSNIKIESGDNYITIPINISNKKIVEIFLKTKNEKLPILIKGNISINLFITDINIPINIREDIDISQIVKQQIETKLESVNNITNEEINKNLNISKLNNTQLQKLISQIK